MWARFCLPLLCLAVLSQRPLRGLLHAPALAFVGLTLVAESRGSVGDLNRRLRREPPARSSSFAQTDHTQEVIRVQRTEVAAPRVVRLASPRAVAPARAAALSGSYELVPGVLPSGFPLWKQRSGRHWLFKGTSGRWIVGDERAKQLDFECDEGILASRRVHKGLAPPPLFGPGFWKTLPEPTVFAEAGPKAENVAVKWSCIEQKKISVEVWLKDDGSGTVEDDCVNYGFSNLAACKRRCEGVASCFAFNFDPRIRYCGSTGFCGLMDWSVDPTPVHWTPTGRVCSRPSGSASLGPFAPVLRIGMIKPVFCQPFGSFGEYRAPSGPRNYTCNEICGAGYMACNNGFSAVNHSCLHNSEIGCLVSEDSLICSCNPPAEGTPKCYETKKSWLSLPTRAPTGKMLGNWKSLSEGDMSWELWIRILKTPPRRLPLIGSWQRRPYDMEDWGEKLGSRRRFASVFMLNNGSLTLETNVGNSAGNNSVAGVKVQVDRPVNDGKWHSLAAVWSRSEKKAYLLLDGVASEGSLNYDPGDDDVAADGHLFVCSSDDIEGSPRQLACQVSNLQLWNRPLRAGMVGTCMITQAQPGLMARFLLSGNLDPAIGEFKLESVGEDGNNKSGTWKLGRPAKSCEDDRCNAYQVTGAGSPDVNGQYALAKNEEYQGAAIFKQFEPQEGPGGFSLRLHNMRWAIMKANELFYVAPEGLKTPAPPRGKWISTPDVKGKFPGPTVRCDEDSSCEWSGWSEWTQCDKSCGLGLRQRTRGPTANSSCKDTSEGLDVDDCKIAECPVNCKFGEWGDWGPCSLSCGKGARSRPRKKVLEEKFGGTCLEAPVFRQGCSDWECPVDCVFGAWSDWSDCDKTCGNGVALARRRTVGSPLHGGAECQGSSYREKPCNSVPCPDLCDWSPWGLWSDCSVTCAAGQHSRIRAARLTEAGEASGATCTGRVVQTAACTVVSECPRHCEWTAWGDWASCSKTCGTGKTTRERQVYLPAAAGGMSCVQKLANEVRPCKEMCCPVDCVRSSWAKWEPCTRTCGAGAKRWRFRKFDAIVSCGGVGCSPGRNEEEQSCPSEACPVDCRWSEWSGDGCSLTCGSGTQFMRRHMVRLEKHGGTRCTGPSGRLGACEMPPCPIFCEWKSWNEWDTCSKSCGAGFRRRTREIIKEGAYGGITCSNHSFEFGECNLEPCPVNCHLLPWLEWGPCSVSCGGGGLKRRFRFSSGEPDHGGTPCAGALDQHLSCGDQSCAIDCQWDTWSAWGNCTGSPGSPRLSYRKRQVLVEASNGGINCQGARVEVTTCVMDCMWFSWQSWSMCSASCRPAGQRFRKRKFRPARNGGHECKGSADETAECADEPCPVDCRWDVWGKWGSCDKSCGIGSKSRFRGVASTIAFGGRECVGNRFQVMDCNSELCPKDCTWLQWGEWGICTATCGGGMVRRYRLRSPEVNGGKACTGQARMDKSCATQGCPQDCRYGMWGDWSFCDKSCGNGIRTRTRGAEGERFGAQLRCPAYQSERSQCNHDPCPIDGWIAPWQAWAPCSETCGGGVQRRERFIYEPKFGGVPLPDNIITAVRKDCNTQDCPKDCKWATWTDWTECSGKRFRRSAERGSKMRSRKIAQHADSFGEECIGKSAQVLWCYPPCDIDCRWDDWMQWTGCTPLCPATPGTSKKTRTRVQRPARMGNGKSCSGNRTEEAPCDACPIHCQFDQWVAWDDCTRACRGLHFSHRNVAQEAKYGGQKCLQELKERDALCNVDAKGCTDADKAKWTNPRKPMGKPKTTTTTTTTTTAWIPCPLMLSWAAVENTQLKYLTVANQKSIAARCAESIKRSAEIAPDDVKVTFRSGTPAAAVVNGTNGSTPAEAIVVVVEAVARKKIQALRLYTPDRSWEEKLFQAVYAGFMELPDLSKVKAVQWKPLVFPVAGEPNHKEIQAERKSASCLGDMKVDNVWMVAAREAARITMRMGKPWTFIGKKVHDVILQLGGTRVDILSVLASEVYPAIGKSSESPKAAAMAVMSAGFAASACAADVAASAGATAANVSIEGQFPPLSMVIEGALEASVAGAGTPLDIADAVQSAAVAAGIRDASSPNVTASMLKLLIEGHGVPHFRAAEIAAHAAGAVAAAEAWASRKKSTGNLTADKLRAEAVGKIASSSAADAAKKMNASDEEAAVLAGIASAEALWTSGSDGAHRTAVAEAAVKEHGGSLASRARVLAKLATIKNVEVGANASDVVDAALAAASAVAYNSDVGTFNSTNMSTLANASNFAVISNMASTSRISVALASIVGEATAAALRAACKSASDVAFEAGCAAGRFLANITSGAHTTGRDSFLQHTGSMRDDEQVHKEWLRGDRDLLRPLPKQTPNGSNGTISIEDKRNATIVSVAVSAAEAAAGSPLVLARVAGVAVRAYGGSLAEASEEVGKHAATASAAIGNGDPTSCARIAIEAVSTNNRAMDIANGVSANSSRPVGKDISIAIANAIVTAALQNTSTNVTDVVAWAERSALDAGSSASDVKFCKDLALTLWLMTVDQVKDEEEAAKEARQENLNAEAAKTGEGEKSFLAAGGVAAAVIIVVVIAAVLRKRKQAAAKDEADAAGDEADAAGGEEGEGEGAADAANTDAAAAEEGAPAADESATAAALEPSAPDTVDEPPAK